MSQHPAFQGPHLARALNLDAPFPDGNLARWCVKFVRIYIYIYII